MDIIKIEIKIKEDIKMLANRKRASEIRNEYDMDAIDKDPDKQGEIIFPNHLNAVITPFITTLLSSSLNHLGSDTEVIQKYKITANERVTQQVYRILSYMVPER